MSKSEYKEGDISTNCDVQYSRIPVNDNQRGDRAKCSCNQRTLVVLFIGLVITASLFTVEFHNKKPPKIKVDTSFLSIEKSHCYDKFKNVLLVVIYNYALYDSIPMLKDYYGMIFPNIVFCGPQANEKYKILVVEHEKGYWGYECLGAAIRKYQGFTGYFYINDDTLINWWNLIKFDTNRVWVSGENIITALSGQDMSREKPDNSWHWWYDVEAFARCKKAFNQVEKISTLTNAKAYKSITSQALTTYFRNTNKLRLCGQDDSDVIYVPERVSALYANLSSIFFKHKVFLEVSLPTIARFLDSKTNFQALNGFYLRYRYGSINFNSGFQFWENYDTQRTFFHPLKLSTSAMNRQLMSKVIMDFGKMKLKKCTSSNKV